METFMWMPSGFKLARTPRVLTAQFGDGYRQDAAAGLNAGLAQWELEFEVVDQTARDIDDFLSARGGHERFLFHTPRGGGEQAVCICPKWAADGRGKRKARVSATFVEVAG